jgi:hypothetical protein
MRLSLVMGALLGCANGHGAAKSDANVRPPIDAAADASCVPSVDNSSELLTNGAFDTTPLGTGWTITPANSQVITISLPVLAQSTPAKAEMGSAVASSIEIHQDVAVPAATTILTLGGFYQVRAQQQAMPVDTCKVELATTAGAPIELALALDNTNATMSWTAFSHTFAANVAGQTVRLSLTTKTALQGASFYFDTLSLYATRCGP